MTTYAGFGYGGENLPGNGSNSVVSCRHNTTACSRAGQRRLTVARHHALAADLLIAQEATGRCRLVPVLARPEYAGTGYLPQPLGQQHGAPVQARVTQINCLEFLFRSAQPIHLPL
jgi:hypothetical protein